jgi:short-subunit dehydrogenase involved in D-alanine esterification of teichoic acids
MSTARGIRLFEGAVAIVSGGASGIGLALGRALARRGAEVVLADRDEEPAENAAAAIRQEGGRATSASLDVREFAPFRALVEATAERHGRLDFLFNNAGIAIAGEVTDYLVEHWHRLFDVNIRGVSNGVQAAYPIMVQQGFGHLVNTASIAGLMPAPGGVAYCAIRTAILENAGRYGTMLRPIDEATQRRLWERLHPLDPDEFAERVLPAVARNKGIILLPGSWRLICWLNQLSPALGDRISRHLFERTLGELFPETDGNDSGS